MGLFSAKYWKRDALASYALAVGSAVAVLVLSSHPLPFEALIYPGAVVMLAPTLLAAIAAYHTKPVGLTPQTLLAALSSIATSTPIIIATGYFKVEYLEVTPAAIVMALCFAFVFSILGVRMAPALSELNKLVNDPVYHLAQRVRYRYRPPKD
ncbi:MAG: hypothetical protein HRU11_08295 [Parvularculaceae bacterium]|nr:hypothetical protein [Parvularculaceae bacterium]